MGGRSAEDHDDDGSNALEVHDRKHPEVAFTTEKPLAARPRIAPALIGFTNGAIDEVEVGDRRVLLKDLRVDKRGEHDLDAFGRSRAQHHLHVVHRHEAGGHDAATDAPVLASAADGPGPAVRRPAGVPQ